MATDASVISSGGNFLASAAGDLFGGKGQGIKAEYGYKAAAGYRSAAELARQNKRYSQESNRIKQMQADRQIYQVIGGQQADVAGAGFVASGSALDLLADSASQGELTKHLLTLQGKIDANSYEQQARSLEMQAMNVEAEAKAAEEAQSMSWITAGIKAVAGIASIASGVGIPAGVGLLASAGGDVVADQDRNT